MSIYISNFGHGGAKFRCLMSPSGSKLLESFSKILTLCSILDGAVGCLRPSDYIPM